MTPEQELRHLESGSSAGDEPGGAGLLDVEVRADDVGAVVRRLRDLLAAALRLEPEAFTDPREAATTLPSWFLAACADEPTEAEREAWLVRWRAMSPAERTAAEAEERWTAANWLSWMEPEDRPWFFWDAVEVDDRHATVRVEVPGLPTATGALVWALRAAGATDVSVA